MSDARRTTSQEASPPADAGPRLRLDLAYAGHDFHGWQEQPGRRTVQGVLREHLSRLLGRPAVPVGAGRTDAGVNARGQVAHLTVMSLAEADRVKRALPRLMPVDIEVLAVRRVAPAFNARRSATARRYSYHFLFRRDVFHTHCWQLRQDLDRAACDVAAAAFRGRQDFTSFCKSRSLKDDGNVCEVGLCAFEWRDDSAIFHVKANRFLHHMVRNMVGTLIEIGRGDRDSEDITRILAARERAAAGRMAPPQGLFLEEVVYPSWLLDPLGTPADAAEGDPK